jgi:hypothetical protein
MGPGAPNQHRSSHFGWIVKLRVHGITVARLIESYTHPRKRVLSITAKCGMENGRPVRFASLR